MPSATPVPVRDAVVGSAASALPPRLTCRELSITPEGMESVPWATPPLCGAKSTTIEQVTPGARFVPHPLLTSTKLLSSTEGSPRLIEPVPVLVRLNAWVGLVVPTCCVPKSKLKGLNETGGGVTPVPVSVMVPPYDGESSQIPIVCENGPNAVGRNVAVMVQLLPGLYAFPGTQVVEHEKAPP